MTNHASRPPKNRLGRKILIMLIFSVIITSVVSAPNKTITDWMGDNSQIDDILVIGVRA